MIDVGCIDFNLWASRMQSPNEPGYIWLDLDPTIPDKLKAKQRLDAEDKGFSKAIEVALACRKILDKYKLTGIVKTSGKTGLQIYIPYTGFRFEEPQAIAYHLADEAHKLVPHISTRQESKDLRGDKVYIDVGQNDYADILAAPYSVRPYHEPLISTPLEWKQVGKRLDRYGFTIDTIMPRLKKKAIFSQTPSLKKLQPKIQKCSKPSWINLHFL